MCSLYTIGYEKTEIDEFIKKLIDNKIEAVIDVRLNPISRRHDYSKKRLEIFLNSYKIRYIHMGELGSPKNIRDQLHETNDYTLFFQRYRQYICVNEYDSVVKALRMVESNQSCLLCYEKNPKQCHRSILSNMICAISTNIDGVVNL